MIIFSEKQFDLYSFFFSGIQYILWLKNVPLSVVNMAIVFKSLSFEFKEEIIISHSKSDFGFSIGNNNA